MVAFLRLRRTALLPTLALALATLLAGCVPYPAGYGYSYEPAPYYASPVAAYESRGWGWDHHHHHDRR